MALKNDFSSKIFPTGYFYEFKQIFRLAWPVVCNNNSVYVHLQNLLLQSNRINKICNLFLLLVLHFQILTELLQFMMQPMAVIFCGHLGKAELDAVALANSVSLKLFRPKVTLNNFWSHKPYCKGHARYLFKISDCTKFRTSLRTIRI